MIALANIVPELSDRSAMPLLPAPLVRSSHAQGRHVGLWIEPEHDIVFQPRTSSGIGTTGAVLVGW